MKFLTSSLAAGLALSGMAFSQETTTQVSAPVQPASAATASEPSEAEPTKPANEREGLETANKLAAERLTAETNELRAEITRLKMERELLSEKLALESTKRQAATADELVAYETEKDKLQRTTELAKAEAERLSHELKIAQAKSAIEITELQSQITRIEKTDERSQYADSKPVYLENPLREDGMLVVSDRRIQLNGLITEQTADYVTERIHYWNNKDGKMPIFIVIDASPGGSVMAGYRILKSMESSEAPVHVVVKSLAASMAAAITTLAEESYVYPNAIVLHHQISSRSGGQINLTQQREFYEESQRWWARLASPIAEKMGISTDEFIKRMYEHSSSGDWSEFGEDACKLKWANHVITGINETSFTKSPDAGGSRPAGVPVVTAQEVDADGKVFSWLPRLSPKDVYFLYNPDGYYRAR